MSESLSNSRLIPSGRAEATAGSVSRGTVWIWVAIAVFVCMAFAAWKLTPLGDYVQPAALRHGMSALRSSWWSLPAIWTLFVVSGLLVVPINLIFLAVGLTFGFTTAVGLSLSGGILSALVLTEIGRRLEMDALFERAPATLRKIRDRNLRHAGVLELSILRLLPLGPFTTMNLLWGAAGVPRRRVVFASMIGLLPGVTATSLIGDGLTMQDLSGPNLLAIGLGIACMLGLAIWGRRWMKRHSDA